MFGKLDVFLAKIRKQLPELELLDGFQGYAYVEGFLVIQSWGQVGADNSSPLEREMVVQM